MLVDMNGVFIFRFRKYHFQEKVYSYTLYAMPNRVNIIVLVFILLLGKPRKREMQDASSEIMDSDMFLSASCLCIEQSTFVYCNKTLTHDRIHGALS